MRHGTGPSVATAEVNSAEPTCMAVTQASHVVNRSAMGSATQCHLAAPSVSVRAS